MQQCPTVWWNSFQFPLVIRKSSLIKGGVSERRVQGGVRGWVHWETKDLTVCDDKKQSGRCSREAPISSSSLRRCLSVSACLGILSMQISVPWSVPGTELILVPFSQRLTKYDPRNISVVIDSARWRSLGNKCVVREIYLAAFDVIMWERRHWRNVASKSEGCGSCQWFCHSYRVIAVIPSRAVLLKNHFTLGPIHCCGYEWEEKIDRLLSHNTVKLFLLPISTSFLHVHEMSVFSSYLLGCLKLFVVCCFGDSGWMLVAAHTF